MPGVPIKPQSDDANPDDGQKWDQVLKGEDYDLDADGTVDHDVAVDPSTTEASATDAPPTSRA